MNRKRVHPGAFIKRNYVDALGLTQAALADALGVHRGTLSRLLHEQSDVTPEMAVKLSKVLGRTPESWLAMQSNHDLSKLNRVRVRGKLRGSAIVPTGKASSASSKTASAA